MIAYNPVWIQNLFTRQWAQQAFHEDGLNKEELDNISTKYPVLFYTPNFFIRVGLIILTAIICLFSFALLVLVFVNSIQNAIGGLAIFYSILTYAALEYMVKTKRHFQSGVDDALLWIFSGALFAGINYVYGAGDIANCAIIFIISFYCLLRFADRLMSVVCYVSLLCIFFFSCVTPGAAAKALVPFVMMAVSAIVYLFVRRGKKLEINMLYSDCLQVISISALISFYISGNYFVVRELSNEMFNLRLADTESIPFGWVFWFFTVAIPVLYISRGIQKKDNVLLRVGLLFVAAIVFTVRYYYAILSVEALMAAGGIALMLISYSLSRYFKAPRYGFTILEVASAQTPGKTQIESIIIAQAFTGPATPADVTKFGGGSFGGGGASGGF